MDSLLINVLKSTLAMNSSLSSVNNLLVSFSLNEKDYLKAVALCSK